MPVTRDQSAPYAPASSIMALVERHRTKGLPNPVDADVLGRAGVPDSLINRVLQALQALDLITDTGEQTDVLEGIRLAPEAEYKQRLAEWLNSAYADALTFVDPVTDDEVAIRDAFRSYKPVGQQARMVTLFMGLFTAAGVMPERPKQSPTGKASTGTPRSRASSSKAPSARPGTVRKGDQFQPKTLGATGLPAPLAGLLQTLPAYGEGWTEEQRAKFIATFEAVVDFCFPVVAKEAVQTNTATGQ